MSIEINHQKCMALLDTGSCVSLISHSYYQKNLTNIPIEPVSDILNVECADGGSLPYIGYVRATIAISSGLARPVQQECLFLVTPDTKFTEATPILLGTNILEVLLEDCRKNDGKNFLQKSNLFTPWYLTFRCMVIRERELRRNNNRIAIVKCAEIGKRILGPNQSINVKAYVDKGMEYQPTNCIVQETKDSSLPDFVDVTPGLIQYKYGQNEELMVNISNLTTDTVIIQPKSIICELQPVSVDEGVFEHQSKCGAMKKTLDEVHIDENLSTEDRAQLLELLDRHKDIFSQDDSDIGECTAIKHRIDLIDEIPFKQRHRRIPPAMVDDVRQHLEQLLASGIIRKSKSPYASNVVLVRKKNGKLRMCIDYRVLNSKSSKDSYALPRIEEVFDVLHGTKFFSTVDMKSGYH